MPLFRVDLAEIEGLEEEGSVVVHEGDGPKGLARYVCDRLSHGYIRVCPGVIELSCAQLALSHVLCSVSVCALCCRCDCGRARDSLCSVFCGILRQHADGGLGLWFCVRAALKYHREKRDEDCVPDGSGKAVRLTSDQIPLAS